MGPKPEATGQQEEEVLLLTLYRISGLLVWTPQYSAFHHCPRQQAPKSGQVYFGAIHFEEANGEPKIEKKSRYQKHTAQEVIKKFQDTA